LLDILPFWLDYIFKGLVLLKSFQFVLAPHCNLYFSFVHKVQCLTLKVREQGLRKFDNLGVPNVFIQKTLFKNKYCAVIELQRLTLFIDLAKLRSCYGKTYTFLAFSKVKENSDPTPATLSI
jgi:hypothetical protein